jgi:hypothetical protein
MVALLAALAAIAAHGSKPVLSWYRGSELNLDGFAGRFTPLEINNLDENLP